MNGASIDKITLALILMASHYIVWDFGEFSAVTIRI